MADDNPIEHGGREVSHVVEHLFRHESAKMVAILTGIFGLEHFNLAEDVVQEALARALQTWPFYGLPQNPAAWIMRASRNLALDVVRRDKVFRGKEPEIIRLMESAPVQQAAAVGEEEIPDDRLRMMFVCCHPVIAPEAQAALALRTLCGFSVAEISRAFLTSEAATAKRLTRAKQSIREAGLRFEIPAGPELAVRVEGVLHTLYLLFNEGYKASSGETLIRQDVCEEAIRLTALLAGHRSGDRPDTHALLALMLLNTSRLSARMDGDGALLRLQEQDRGVWDQRLIARGLYHLARSASGTELSEYHVQAGIAACHCTAKRFDATDWPQILDLYDRWLHMNESPVVALNRAVVVANLHGPQAGLEAVAAIPDRKKLESYYLLHAVLGEFEKRKGNESAAAGHFHKSLEFVELKSEREFLEKRLQSCVTTAVASLSVSGAGEGAPS